MKNSLKVTLALIITGVFGIALLASNSASAGFFQDFFSKFTPQQTEEQIAEEEVPEYSPFIEYENAVISAVEAASESVVSIVITKDLPIIERCAYDPFGNLPPEFRQFFGGGGGFTQPCDTGKTEEKEVGGGSGFVISADGMILTNKHVISDEDANYTVLTNDGEKYDAEVLARDPIQDIAIIKIESPAGGLQVAKLGDSDSIRLGQTAIAIGNALAEFRNTVSVGVISGLARNITARGGDSVEKIEDLIQTDAAINPGNSGGPLLNLRGEVIGINTAVAENAQGIGFAIPINYAKRAIESVKTLGRIAVPYIGVRYLAITPEVAESQDLPVEHGALVRGGSDGPAIVADSPAAKAGLLVEDIILEINGQKIDKDQSLISLVQKYNVGETVTLTILRAGETLEIQVTLGERP